MQFSDVFYISTLLSGLAESLTEKGAQPQLDGFDDDEEEVDTFKKDAIHEIERYRRTDEWISSYHNVYSVTALDCLLKLARNKIHQPRLVDFLQYTRPGMADPLRIKAMSCLVDLGMLNKDVLIQYFLYCLSTDPSPYMREKTCQIFWKGLGRIAIGEKTSGTGHQAVNGLIIEQEGSTEGRQADFARRRTIPGALAALKAEVGNNEVLKRELWRAVW
jgi:transcription initiation factor TFIID subunit 2